MIEITEIILVSFCIIVLKIKQNIVYELFVC